MKVLYDHQIWSHQRFGGASRIFSEVTRHSEGIPGYSYDIALQHTNNDYIKSNPKVAKATKMFSDKKSLLSRLRILLRNSATAKRWYTTLKERANKRTSIRALEKSDFDVFHPTHYDPYFLPYLKEKPFVITVYDMIHELYPEYFVSKNITAPQKKLLTEKATRIIAISENTKNDLVKILGIDPKKIDVVYLASNFNEIEPKKIKTPKRYLLYVGSRVRYKNFSVVVRGAAPLLLSEKDLYLLCAGGGVFTKEEESLIRELGIERKVVRQEADDRELSYLYRHAECFVFASLYEGFGIPILEALSSGCPAVLSNASCFPEIAGNAAIYFEPTDPTSLTKALKKICGDRNYRSQLIQLGNKKAEEYSWKKTAEKTRAVYYSCLS
ncbi:MAG: glycosyltransferase family 1 protein [Candidatus Parcubacteria bacterium]|nr:glycosyltransferase family 1 protein [Candidatus Parcubacteria bacterium]